MIMSVNYYILNESIIQLVKWCYEVENEEDWSTWGQDNLVVANTYFSPPYPTIAIQELGYPAPELTTNNN